MNKLKGRYLYPQYWSEFYNEIVNEMKSTPVCVSELLL